MNNVFLVIIFRVERRVDDGFFCIFFRLMRKSRKVGKCNR